MTQNEFLLRYLKRGQGITTLQAHRYGITSLASRICEIKKKGHKIRRIPKKVPTRYGNGKVMVVEYRIG